MAKKKKQEEKLSINDAGYLGVHMEPLIPLNERLLRSTHKVFLYNCNEISYKKFNKLGQIVNVYEHNIFDFESNSLRIINHYVKHIGNHETMQYSLGNLINFRVHPDGPVYRLSLFKFLMNYTMLILPVIMGHPLDTWKPWTPKFWSAGSWINEMDQLIRVCRPLGNMRAICECVGWSKYLINLWVNKVGFFINLSISNNNFLDLINTNEFVRDTITCNYEFKDDPTEREDEIDSRARRLMIELTEAENNPLSVLARNGLFNQKQLSELAVGLGNKPDLHGNTIPYTAHTNIFMGLKDPIAHTVDARGGRKAETLKGNVADAGALQRSLSMMMGEVRYVDEYECDSKHFRTKYVDTIATLEKLEGRVMCVDEKKELYHIIYPAYDTHLVGKTIKIKTPISCTHPMRKEGVICTACYGMLMGRINRDVHIGKLAALQSSDELEQNLLSAKHILKALTRALGFPDIFNDYFDIKGYEISVSERLAKACCSGEHGELSSTYEKLKETFLEFHLDTMYKSSDGEGRHFDRGIKEIIIFNREDNNHISITEDNLTAIYLSPEFVTNVFLKAADKVGETNVVSIPFSDLIDPPHTMQEFIFECRYKNQEIAEGLMELIKIITTNDKIAVFKDFDECLDTMIPLFEHGGIHLPDLQAEMLVTKLVCDPEGGLVKWDHDKPKYNFIPLNKSVENDNSPIRGIAHRSAKAKLAGGANTFNKDGVSEYDYFMWTE